MPRASTIALWAALVLTLVGRATPAVRAQAALSPSIAYYQVTHDGRTERLHIVRTSERIEYRYTTRGITEIWTRDPRGELSHWKVFHRAQRSVHYTAGDLRAIEAEPSWEQLATLLNSGELSKLKPSGVKRTARGTAKVLVGSLAGIHARVLWNDAIDWAEHVVLGDGAKGKRYRLLFADACSASSCAPFDTGSLREVEFADLGDMEGDPFVRTFLATFAGHEHSHP